MKKLLAFALVAALAAPAIAEEEESSSDDILAVTPSEPDASKNTGVWPAFLAISEIPSADRTPDIIGLRVTIPFSVSHESVTGFDIGLWGRAQNFEGFMFSILRNDVADSLSGFQAGVYNSANQANLFGVQLGVWNEAGSIRGGQLGLINTAGVAEGVQVGVINRCEEMYGVQIGLVNVIRCAEIKFCPIVNVGF